MNKASLVKISLLVCAISAVFVATVFNDDEQGESLENKNLSTLSLIVDPPLSPPHIHVVKENQEVIQSAALYTADWILKDAEIIQHPQIPVAWPTLAKQTTSPIALKIDTVAPPRLIKLASFDAFGENGQPLNDPVKTFECSFMKGENLAPQCNFQKTGNSLIISIDDPSIWEHSKIAVFASWMVQPDLRVETTDGLSPSEISASWLVNIEINK